MITLKTIIGSFLCLSSLGLIIWVQYYEEEKNWNHYLIFMLDILIAVFLILFEMPIIIESTVLIITVYVKAIASTGNFYTWVGIIASMIYAFSSSFLIYERSIPMEIPGLEFLMLPFEKKRMTEKEKL